MATGCVGCAAYYTELNWHATTLLIEFMLSNPLMKSLCSVQDYYTEVAVQLLACMQEAHLYGSVLPTDLYMLL